MIKSCYIHIPFCESICSYCDFSKLLYNSKLVDKYLDSLEKEINSIYKGELLDTIYIGGGTPSSLNIKQLKRLFEIIDILHKSNNTEYTIECNFQSITKEKLELFKTFGINRISLGIESINKDNLKLLERELNKEDIIDKIKLCKSLGFNNINVDLMYALPTETLKILEEDIDFILSLDIEHISTYSLIIEKHTKLSINNIKNISEELDYEMYKLICNKLKDYGYNHYEISNFSKKGYESKHNLCYWYNNEYYGFGLGASSFINNERKTNTRSINKYLDGNYNYETEKLTKEDKIEYEVILNLRLIEGIDLLKFKDKYHIELNSIYNYKPLLDDNLLVYDNNHLYIPEDKIYVSNEIIIKFIQNKYDRI